MFVNISDEASFPPANCVTVCEVVCSHLHRFIFKYMVIKEAKTDELELPGLSSFHKLHRIFIVEEGIHWLVVVRDAKTYDILQNLRREYGGQLQWMLPLSGDWHILYNYQKVPEAPPSQIPPSQVRATANILAHQLATITSEAELEDFQKHMNTVFKLMEKISDFMPFHSKCLNNLKHHLAMDEKTPKTLPVSTSRDRTAEGNI